MTKTLLFLCFFLFSILVYSQDYETDPTKYALDTTNFYEANNDSEILDAASAEYDRADATLNHLYKLISEKYAENPLFISHLRDAQIKWLEYRDLHIESILPVYENHMLEYGTLYLPTYYLELASVTWQRVRDLYRWVKPDNSHGSFGRYREPS